MNGPFSRQSSTAFQVLEEGGCVAMRHGPIRTHELDWCICGFAPPVCFVGNGFPRE